MKPSDKAGHPASNQKNTALIFSRQTAQLYATVNFALFAALVNAVLLVFVLWPVIDHQALLTWFAVLVVISIARSINAYAFKKSRDEEEHLSGWHKYFLLGSILSALTWGSSAIWLFPENDIIHQVFLAFVLGGISTGAITSLSYTRSTIYSFIGLILTPLLLRIYFKELEHSVPMVLLLTLYMIMLLFSASRTYATNRLSLSLQIESIEQQRSIEENEHRYQTLLETATDAFFLNDLNGKLLDVNKQACKSLGYSRDELLQMSVEDIDIGPEPDKFRLLQPVLDSGENIQIESIHRRKDGTTFPVEVSIGLIRMDGVTLYSVLSRDITGRKRIEKMKNEFISTVSHELRTPLTAIRGSLGLLEKGVLGEFNPAAKEMITIASNNCERLLLLINDLLDLQKFDSENMTFHFEVIPVVSFLKQTIMDNSTYADLHNVSFVLDNNIADASIWADRNRLTQVMANVLSNAAKFSPTNSRVQISASPYNNHFIRIAVTDHGAGIPKEFQEKVFDKFSQSDSSDSRVKGGTGLGLSISQSLITKQHGKISFVSNPGEGTTFFIDLPESSSAAETR